MPRPHDVDPDLLKRIAELVDGDQWVLADLLVDEFPPEEWGEDAQALEAELEEYGFHLVTDYGIELKTGTLAEKRYTALAWPRTTRVVPAPFAVYRYTRGPDRVDQLTRYLKMNQGKPLTKRTVARLKAEENPRPANVKPWGQRVEDQINQSVKKATLENRITNRPDWWMLASEDERATVVRVLRTLASAIAKGPIEEATE